MLDRWVDLLEDTWILGNTHLGELLGPVVLVKRVVGMLLELFHVGADEHLSEFDEVAMLLIVDFDNAPRISSSANLASIGSCDFGIGTNDGERNLGHNLGVLGDRLLVVELVARALENLNVVVLDICQNLGSLLVCEEPIQAIKLTRCLKAMISSSVRVSAFAITGIKLTLV